MFNFTGKGSQRSKQGTLPTTPTILPRRLPRKRALLVGVERQEETTHEESVSRKKNAMDPAGEIQGAIQGSGAGKDIKKIKKLLIAKYNYLEQDIATLTDEPDVPEPLQSKRDNILRQLQSFLDGQELGDQYLFLFSGHTTQKLNDDYGSEDHMDECLVGSDGLTVTDDQLVNFLTRRLLPGNHLVVIFDSDSSGTLLDLPHYRCNKVMSVTSSMRHTIRQALDMIHSRQYEGLGRILPHKASRLWRGVPRDTFCSGFCPHHSGQSEHEPYVLYISAAHFVHSKQGEDTSFISVIVANLERNPNPTLKNFVRSVGADFRTMHHEAIEGPKASREFSNLWNPQLSSRHRLDMNSVLIL